MKPGQPAIRAPGPRAGWEEIQTFAGTFNGYEAFGTEECGKLANSLSDAFERTGLLDVDLAHLRSALFFEQRRFRHFGFDPDEPAMRYIRALVAAIGDRITEDKMMEEHMGYTEHERMRDAFGFLKAQLQRIDNSYTNVFGPSVPIKRGTAYVAISGNGALCFASETLAEHIHPRVPSRQGISAREVHTNRPHEFATGRRWLALDNRPYRASDSVAPLPAPHSSSLSPSERSI